MGIPKFYKTLREKINPKFEIVRKFGPKKVKTLLLDANSIFHDTAAKIYKYESGVTYEKKALAAFKQHLKKNPEMVKREHFEAIMEEIISIVRSLRTNIPLVYIAVDGVAPDAKISQQRQRRYKSAQHMPEFFNTSVLTPGTEYMQQLDSFITSWLSDDVNANKIAKKVMYSGHLVPGEGEHKIMDFLHERTSIPVPQGEGSHVIYGLDGDLILLTMLSTHDDLYLYRKSHRDGEVQVEFLAVDRLKNFLKEYLKQDSAVEDFSLIISFIGNDFLPTLPAFNSSLIGEDVMLLLEVYKETFTEGSGIVEDGEINFQNLAAYIQKLAFREEDFYNLIYKKLKNDAQMREYNPILSSAITSKGIDMDKYKTNFHQDAFGLSVAASTQDVELFTLLVNDAFIPNEEGIRNMCINYLNGMMWVYGYYTQGSEKIDKRYFYAYNQAPLLSDLLMTVKFLLKNKMPLEDYLPQDEENNKFVHPLYQLASVIPYESKDILPTELRKLMGSKSTVYDCYPRDFKLKTEGISGEGDMFISKPLLPPLQMHRIIEACTTVVKSVDLENYAQSKIMYYVYQPSKRFMNGGRGRGSFEGRGRGRGGYDNRGEERNFTNERGRGRGDRARGRGGRGRPLEERKKDYRKTQLDF